MRNLVKSTVLVLAALATISGAAHAAGKGFKADKVEPEFKMEDIKLSVKYDTLLGKCNMKVTLKAEFQSNSTFNRTVDFWLFRKDGNSQKNTVKIGPDGKGVFTKTYNFNKPVDRQYMATYKSVKSPWKPMKVKCSSVSSGGFQN